MASITKQNVGKYTYLYESVSFWDPVKKRPDNDKKRIGKIDIETGEPVYVQEYIDKLASEGQSTEGMKIWDRTGKTLNRGVAGRSSEADIARAVLGSVQDFGAVYFLRELAERIGMLGALREALPCALCFPYSPLTAGTRALPSVSLSWWMCAFLSALQGCLWR